jgi:hypothetical protein
MSLGEYRWCMREFVRGDVMFRFMPLWGGDLAPLGASLDRWRERCRDKIPPDDAARDEVFGPLRRFGVMVVRDALDEVRGANPTLAMREKMSAAPLPEGWTDAVTVLEAQGILDFIGFGPLGHDGKMGAITRSSIRAFQDAVGIEADGILDLRTGSLLRNAALSGSKVPVRLVPVSGQSGGGRAGRSGTEG